MLGCLAFLLFVENTVVGSFYSANKDGRAKFLQPVRERMGMLEIYLASLLKLARVKRDLENTDFAVTYELLSRLPQHYGSWKPEGNSSHSSKGNTPGIPSQPWLMACVSFMLFSLELLTWLNFGRKNNTGHSYEGVF